MNFALLFRVNLSNFKIVKFLGSAAFLGLLTINNNGMGFSSIDFLCNATLTSSFEDGTLHVFAAHIFMCLCNRFMLSHKFP